MSRTNISLLTLIACILSILASTQTLAASAKNAPPPAAGVVRVVIVGDTTARDKLGGWGPGFKSFFSDKAEYINLAVGGRSSKKFIDENRWAKALAIKADYYLIQFGHNDESAKDDTHTDPNTTYKQFISRYVDEARANGAKPILITSLVRRQWDPNDPNKIKSSLVPYAEAAKAVAAEKKVPLVDLHARSIEIYQQLGKEKANELAALKDDGSIDNTHVNEKGSVLFGKVIAQELIKVEPDLKPCFKFEEAPDANSASK